MSTTARLCWLLVKDPCKISLEIGSHSLFIETIGLTSITLVGIIDMCDIQILFKQNICAVVVELPCYELFRLLVHNQLLCNK